MRKSSEYDINKGINDPKHQLIVNKNRIRS